MMVRNVFLGTLLLFALAFMSVAQEKATDKVQIKRIPVMQVDPTSGQQMFASYCASCHGQDAKGYGPASPALKTQPPDLTTMAKRHKGAYPTFEVTQIIKGDVASPGHGNQEMPVWGPIFRSLHHGADRSVDPHVQLRITTLNRYIESLQQR